MPRVIIINDIHYTRNAPRCRAEDYHKEILAKLRWVCRTAKTLKVQAIVCTGDWFHRKGKVTFRESNDILSILDYWKESGLKVASILGNHDIAGHSIDSMDTRAVGTFVHSGVMQLLDYGPLVLEDDTGRLTITGNSFFHHCDRDDESRLKMYGRQDDLTDPSRTSAKHKEGVSLHLAHGTLMVKGSFFGEFTKANDLIKLLDKNDAAPDILACGHLHFDEDIHEFTSGNSKMTICRNGSLSRVSSNDFNRSPSVVLVVTKKDKFICKKIPIKVANELAPIERQDTEEETKVTDETIRTFIASLKIQSDTTSVSDLPGLIEKTGNATGFSTSSVSIATDLVRGEQ